MSTSTTPRKPLHALSRLDTNLSSLNTPRSYEDTPSPSSTRSGTFARLRLGTQGMRRSKSTKSLGRIQSQGTMSIYSDATTVAEPTPPLPTSASELTLAHSVASSSKSIKEESPISMAKSFMQRSSRMLLKKKSSKNSLNSRTLEWIDDTRVAKSEGDLLTRRAAKHARAESAASRQERDNGTSPDSLSNHVRPRISQPFNFQHLAHTVTDGTINGAKKFSTHRNSQVPGGLRGINAHDLPVPLSAVEPRNNPLRSPEFQLRSSRSMDSFKRVSRCSFSTPYPPTIIPPPRRSSRRPTPLNVPQVLQSEQESPTLPDFARSGRRGSATPRTVSPKSPLSISTGADDSPLSMMGIAQAVTTPDETAYVMKGELISSLADVPEEEDSSLQNRSSPTAAFRRRRDMHSRVFRAGSDPILPEVAEQTEDVPRAPKRVSGHVTDGFFLDLDWDEDIDYCYDQLEAEGLEADEPCSPLSDGDVLYMNQSRRSKRLSRSGVSMHLRRVSTQMREDGLGLRFPTTFQDPNASSNGNPGLAINQDCLQPDGSKRVLPLFTPDMTGDLHATYSPRSSFSQISRGGSSRAVSAISSKRASTLTQTENSSAVSVPDLIPSSKRKSSSPRHSSIKSEVPNLEASDASVFSSSVASTCHNEKPKAGNTLDVSGIPLRKRSFSDSASKTLSDAASKPEARSHVRSASHAAITQSPKVPSYTLFPPLDRIGASSAKA